MELVKKVFISLTIVGCVIAISLITASFATDFWIEATPYLHSANPNITDYKGSVNFGLFHGSQTLNYHGIRIKEIWVKDYAFTENIVDSSLWISTIVMGALGIAWGLVSISFAVFNIFWRPIETISGLMGLYLWNGIAFVLTLISVIIFAVHFTQHLSQNVLRQEDTAIKWTSAETAHPGYSFWLSVAACGVYLINILLVKCSGVKLRFPRYSASAEKALDGVMMY